MTHNKLNTTEDFQSKSILLSNSMHHKYKTKTIHKHSRPKPLANMAFLFNVYKIIKHKVKIKKMQK